MPHKVAIFCKSFQDDFYRLRPLLASHDRFCSSIPFILSVPRSQAYQLRQAVTLGPSVQVICDEDYARPWEAGEYGWFQQQVCKLSIHRAGLAESYICVDSDAYFVSALDYGDFFDGDKKRVIYSSLFTKYLPDNIDLREYLLDETFVLSPPPPPGTLEGFSQRLDVFREWIRKSGDTSPIDRGPWINRLFQVPQGTSLQPGQILHGSLLARLEDFFLSQGIGLGDLVKFIPWEFNWYGSWATAAAPDEVSRSTSPIVHFASAEDVTSAKAAGITAERLSARFRIVQMAARHFEALSF